MTWYVIESLAGGSTPPTIVSVDGRRGSWIPAALLERHERIDLTGYLESVRQDPTEIGERVHSRLGPRHLEALPILGPDGEVHGLHLWIGDPAGLPPPPDPVAGIGWDSDTGRVGLSTEAWLMASEATDAYRGTLSPDECLRKIVQFDTAADLVRLSTASRERGAFAGTATILHDRGSLMTWQVIARSRKVGHRTDIRGLVVDISRTEPAVAPSAHRKHLRPHRDRSTAAALLAFSSTFAAPVIAGWIGDRPSWIGNTEPGDPGLFHLDDWDILHAASRALRTADPSDSTVVPIRVRATTGHQWHPGTVTIRRHHGQVGDDLHIIHISRSH